MSCLRSAAVALAIFVFSLTLQPVCQASLTWMPGEGWVDEGGDATHTTTAKGQIDLGHSLESKEDWKSAIKAYSYLVRRWPLSIYSGEAQFKIGLMNEKMGEFWRAFKAYQQVVSKYPGSPFFDLAIERQYSIGNLYLAGERQRLWKIPLLPSQEKTVEIFQSVVKAAPYGKYAPAAYFQMGQAREKQKKWSQAITAYNTILDKYPGSDFADDAQYQIGFAWLSASSEPDYDQSAAQKSIEAFQDFLVRFPNSEKVSQAEAHIKSLQGRTSQGSFNIARFYERSGNKKAAFIYYNEVLKESPDSSQAKKAKERIETLKVQIAEEEKKALAKAGKDKKTSVDTTFISLHALEEESDLPSHEPGRDAGDRDEGVDRVARAIAGDDADSGSLPSAGETGVASTGLQSNDALARENDAIRQADDVIKRSEKEQRALQLPSDQDPVRQLKKATGMRLKDSALPSHDPQSQDTAKLDQLIAASDSTAGGKPKDESKADAKEGEKSARQKDQKKDQEKDKKTEKDKKDKSTEKKEPQQTRASKKEEDKKKQEKESRHSKDQKVEKTEDAKKTDEKEKKSEEPLKPVKPSAGEKPKEQVELKRVEIEPESPKEPSKPSETPAQKPESEKPAEAPGETSATGKQTESAKPAETTNQGAQGESAPVDSSVIAPRPAESTPAPAPASG